MSRILDYFSGELIYLAPIRVPASQESITGNSGALYGLIPGNISGTFVGPLLPISLKKLFDPCLNRSREIPPEAFSTVFFRDSFLTEAVSWLLHFVVGCYNIYSEFFYGKKWSKTLTCTAKDWLCESPFFVLGLIGFPSRMALEVERGPTSSEWHQDNLANTMQLNVPFHQKTNTKVILHFSR